MSSVAMTDSCFQCGGLGWIKAPGRFATKCPDCKDPGSDTYIRDQLAAAGMADSEVVSAMEPWDSSHYPEPTKITGWGARAANEGGGFLVIYSYREEGGRKAQVCGSGKTKACAMSCVAYLRSGGRGLVWAQAQDVLGRVMQERAADFGSARTEAAVLAAKFLVLDDVGTENERRAELVSEWIMKRWRMRGKGYSTMLSTNATSPAQLGDGRIVSRLAAHGVNIPAADYRLRGGK